MLAKIRAILALGKPRYLLATNNAAGEISPIGSSLFDLVFGIVVAATVPNLIATIYAWLFSPSQAIQVSIAIRLALNLRNFALDFRNSTSDLRCSRSNFALSYSWERPKVLLYWSIGYLELLLEIWIPSWDPSCAYVD